MKATLFTVCSCIMCFQVLSQVSACIGSQTDTIYPLDLNKQDLYRELQPMKPLCMTKTIVGMGEATHGTKEFFETKAKVFKFLVTQCHYKIFGIEASYGGCCYINDYIKTGKGSIDQVMMNFDFWTWRTKEVRELVLWCKDYNLHRCDSDKIGFYGFDMQNFYSPLQYFKTFFSIHDTLLGRDVSAMMNPVLSQTELQIYQKLRQPKLNYQDSLTSLYIKLKTWMNSQELSLRKYHSLNDLEQLQLCLENYNLAVKNTDKKNKAWYRDSCMAYMVMCIQKIQKAPMFIWAHNGHINLTYPDNLSVLMGLPMGGYLKKQAGDTYYAMGFVFNQGSFQAIKGPNTLIGALFKYMFAKKKLYKGLRSCTVPVNAKNTFTNALSKTPYPAFLIQMHQTTNPLFLENLKTYDIGAVFLNYKRCSDHIRAKKQFDAILYIQQTKAAEPIIRK